MTHTKKYPINLKQFDNSTWRNGGISFAGDESTAGAGCSTGARIAARSHIENDEGLSTHEFAHKWSEDSNTICKAERQQSRTAVNSTLRVWCSGHHVKRCSQCNNRVSCSCSFSQRFNSRLFARTTRQNVSSRPDCATRCVSRKTHGCRGPPQETPTLTLDWLVASVKRHK